MNWPWLEPRIIKAIHNKQIARHGGAFGIRDEALLESALARPQNLAAYGQPGPFELAACYAFGVARNHPFVDGNKRVALVASVLFLRRNRYHLTAGQAEAAVVFRRLAAGELGESQLAEWFRRNAVPVE